MHPQEHACDLRTESETLLRAHRYKDALDKATEATAILQALGVRFGLLASPAIAVIPDVNLASDDPEITTFWRELAHAHSCRGRALTGLDRTTPALKEHDEAIRIYSTVGQLAEGPELDTNLALALHNRSNCLIRVATREALFMALQSSSQAIDIRERLMTTPETEYVKSVLAGTYKQRASILQNLGRHSEAEVDALRAVRFREELVHEDRRSYLAADLAMTRYTYADILGNQRKFWESLRQLEMAIAVLRDLVSGGQIHLTSDLLYCLAAYVLYGQGFAESSGEGIYPIEMADEAMVLFLRLIEDDRRDILSLFFNFVGQRAVPCAFKAADFARAVRYFDSGLSVLERLISDGELTPAIAQSAIQLLSLPPAALEILCSTGISKERYLKSLQAVHLVLTS
jgi:tetratricopeptide (TPR) repeat protein